MRYRYENAWIFIFLYSISTKMSSFFVISNKKISAGFKNCSKSTINGSRKKNSMTFFWNYKSTGRERYISKHVTANTLHLLISSAFSIKVWKSLTNISWLWSRTSKKRKKYTKHRRVFRFHRPSLAATAVSFLHTLENDCVADKCVRPNSLIYNITYIPCETKEYATLSSQRPHKSVQAMISRADCLTDDQRSIWMRKTYHLVRE